MLVQWFPNRSKYRQQKLRAVLNRPTVKVLSNHRQLCPLNVERSIKQSIIEYILVMVTKNLICFLSNRIIHTKVIPQEILAGKSLIRFSSQVQDTLTL